MKLAKGLKITQSEINDQYILLCLENFYKWMTLYLGFRKLFYYVQKVSINGRHYILVLEIYLIAISFPYAFYDA